MTQYEEQKKILTDEKELLLKELTQIGAVKTNSGVDNDFQARINDTDNDVEDAGDVAQNINTLRRQETIITELETRLQNVDAAIQRIENDEFGDCSVCKKPIEEKRLAVNPAANTCMQHMEV